MIAKIDFRTGKLETAFNSAGALQKICGTRMAKVIMMRMVMFRAAPSHAMVPVTSPSRLDLSSENRDGQFVLDLVQPWQLVFKVSHEPTPRADDGRIDMVRVKAIMIVDVADHH